MKTKLLPYNDDKIDKKKAIISFGPFVLAIVVIAVFTISMINFSNESNRLKRYLQKNGYTCNSTNCIKNDNDKEYLVNYKNGELTINTRDYNMVINSNSVNLHENNSNQNCTYKREDSKSSVKNSTNNDTICEKKIEDINNEITKYKELLFKADVSLNKIEK